MFTVKYRPTQLNDFIGNQSVIAPFTKWLETWNVNDPKTKCALVSGVNGIGKSLLTELILTDRQYHIISFDTDPDLLTTKTIDGKKNCFVVSDVEISISVLVEYICKTRIPIICICDDRYSQSIKPILNYCVDFKLVKPNNVEINKLIYTIIATEKLKIDRNKLEKLLEEANGDIRFIVNYLQFNVQQCETNKDIQSTNIFDTTKQLLAQHNSMNDKIHYYWMSPDLHTLMVHENYVNNILATRDVMKQLEYISYASDSLSDGDIADAVFDFDLSPHVAMNTVKATTKCHDKGMIMFPKYLGKLSTMNKNKREKINVDTIEFPKEQTPKKGKVTKSKAKPTKPKVLKK